MQLEHRSVTHARLQADFHALPGDLSLPQGRVSCLPSPVCPAQRLLAHRCPQDSACSWCWQQGRDGAEASPSWDKAPFTARASHAPSSASASCHQLALLPRMTSGGGGQDRGLTLSVQSLEERELPLLHVLSLVPTPALPAVPPPKFPTEIRWLHLQWSQRCPGKSPQKAGTWHPAILLSSLLVPEAFSTGGEQGKGRGGCRVKAGSLVLHPAGLPSAQRLVSTRSLASQAHHLPQIWAPLNSSWVQFYTKSGNHLHFSHIMSRTSM